MLDQSNLSTQRCRLIFWVECSVGGYLVLAKTIHKFNAYTYLNLMQGHLNQKATLLRPFQFSIFPYKLCFCDISGGRTFLRSIYRFRTQSIETFSTFYFEVKCLKRQLKHECNKISKIRAYFGYILD
jgi:hypothetical protein